MRRKCAAPPLLENEDLGARVSYGLPAVAPATSERRGGTAVAHNHQHFVGWTWSPALAASRSISMTLSRGAIRYARRMTAYVGFHYLTRRRRRARHGPGTRRTSLAGALGSVLGGQDETLSPRRRASIARRLQSRTVFRPGVARCRSIAILRWTGAGAPGSGQPAHGAELEALKRLQSASSQSGQSFAAEAGIGRRVGHGSDPRPCRQDTGSMARSGRAAASGSAGIRQAGSFPGDFGGSADEFQGERSGRRARWCQRRHPPRSDRNAPTLSGQGQSCSATGRDTALAGDGAVPLAGREHPRSGAAQGGSAANNARPPPYLLGETPFRPAGALGSVIDFIERDLHAARPWSQSAVSARRERAALKRGDAHPAVDRGSKRMAPRQA